MRLITGVKIAAGLALFSLIGQVALALFGLPRGFLDWITAGSLSKGEPPAVIVVLGGGSLPSEASLIRAWTGAELARTWTEARVVAALPHEADSLRDELVLRGVAPVRILPVNADGGTHGQAVAVRALTGLTGREPILIVSSPYHLRRAALCFRRQGFSQVRVQGTYHEAFDVKDGITLRYGFWAGLQVQPAILRELLAMAYYKVRGWL